MNRKLTLLVALIILLANTLGTALKVERAEADGTIYIRVDGSIDPPSAPITRDGDNYALIGNIASGDRGIVVERDNMTLDGDGHTLQGNGDMQEVPYAKNVGILLSDRTNITLMNLEVRAYCRGIILNYSTNIMLTNNTITNNRYGVYLGRSTNNTVSDNSITLNTEEGISVGTSCNNTISRNLVTIKDITGYGSTGIYLINGLDNIISGNNISASTIDTKVPPVPMEIGIYLMIMGNRTNITGNTVSGGLAGLVIYACWLNVVTYNTFIDSCAYGIGMTGANNNTIHDNNFVSINQSIYMEACCDNDIYNNNFVSKMGQVYDKAWYDPSIDQSKNLWNKDYAEGGNYWVDFNSTDQCGGPYQNESFSDGVADKPYVIDGANQDNYPLVGALRDFAATSECGVQTICNSTISDFQFNGTAICFDVSGENNTGGFCRIRIPTALINGTCKIFVNGTEVSYALLPCSNSTYTYLYFTCHHSTQEVVIVPEFPSSITIFLFVITTLLTVIVYRRKHTTSTLR